MSIRLIDKKCVAYESGAPQLSPAEIKEFRKELTRDWEIFDSNRMRYEFTFPDFKAAMHFVDKVARLAESEGHHPDIHIRYSRVMIELSTHTIGGLSENDFILAAKIENLPSVQS